MAGDAYGRNLVALHRCRDGRSLLAVLLPCARVAFCPRVGRESRALAHPFWISASCPSIVQIADEGPAPAADHYTVDEWFHITDNSSQHSRERSTDHRWFYHELTELDIHRRGVQCDVFFGL